MSSDRTRKIRLRTQSPLSLGGLDVERAAVRLAEATLSKELSPTMAPTAARVVGRVRGFDRAARSGSLGALASTRRG